MTTLTIVLTGLLIFCTSAFFASAMVICYQFYQRCKQIDRLAHYIGIDGDPDWHGLYLRFGDRQVEHPMPDIQHRYPAELN